MDARTVTAWMAEIARRGPRRARLPDAARRGDRRRRPRHEHGPRVRRGRQGARPAEGRAAAGQAADPGRQDAGRRRSAERAGPLWGTALRRAGRVARRRAGRSTAASSCDALDAALAGVVELGRRRRRATRRWSTRWRRAVDALRAAVDGGRLRSRPRSAAAAEAAEEGARATVPMQARKGRASYLGERSIGHQDPGATSAALIMRALERAVAEAG